MRTTTVLVVTAALLTASPGADAEVLQFGVEAEGLWTDNVFGTFVNEVDDTSGRLAPWFDVEKRDGRVRWGLRYEPAYEYYVDQDGLRGFDHDVVGHFEYHFSRGTKLRITDRFARYRSLSRFNDTSDPGGEINVVGFRQRFKRNRLTGELSHQLGPSEMLRLTVGYNFTEFSNENNADRDVLRTAVSYSRNLSERTVVGSNLAWTQQTFQRPSFDERSTDFYNLSAFVSHQFDRSLQLNLSAGPTYIASESQAVSVRDADEMTPGTQIGVVAFPLFRLDNGNFAMVDADTCLLNEFGERVLSLECQPLEPEISPGLRDSLSSFNFSAVDLIGDLVSPSDSRLTYFAAASLVKSWERWRASLSYTRSFSDSTSAAAVADIIIGRVTWSPLRRWTVELAGSWERQEQATEGTVLTSVVANDATPQPPPPLPPVFPPSAARTQVVRVQELDSDASLDFYRVFLRVNYQLTKRSTAFVHFNWRQERLNADFTTEPDSDRFVVGVGVNYDFDPIPF
jgi:hypothetical protein